MSPEIPQDDPELTNEQKVLLNNFSEEELIIIDEALLSCAKQQWSKVAMVIGMTMGKYQNTFQGVPDIFYTQRVSKLVAEGKLISQENLNHMRFSEVKLP